MTNKIYQQDRYLKEYTAKVVSAEGDCLILDGTIFAPDSGGQPWDLGRIAGVELKKVTEKKGEVLHVLSREDHGISAGDEVKLELDWPRRFDHMQNHLGEHILSGIFKSRFDIDNKGFHLGEKEGTFDLDVKSLTEDMIREVEDLANDVVYQALPVRVEMIHDPAGAEKYPLRKELKVDEDILIVTVPGVDCVACCCPHPSDTSQIGIIKITGTEKYKGMTRVHFLCGRRALLDYRQKHLVMTELCEKYSADSFTLPEKVRIAEEKSEEIRKERNALKARAAAEQAERLLSAAVSSGDSVITGILPDADMEDLRSLAKLLMEQTGLPVVLAAGKSGGALLAHSGHAGVHCGKLVKELAEGGRGGGSETQAQAVFQNSEAMKVFVERAAEAVRNAGK